uniref:Family with sequence similarity 136 member A n=1 Tax=Gorilla gorilla gorilla TaxID=9595 RepID=A0A2I2ZFZ8_GORGO
MAELQQLRVQEAVESMVKSLERENIRKMQVSGPRPSRGAANVKDQKCEGFRPPRWPGHARFSCAQPRFTQRGFLHCSSLSPAMPLCVSVLLLSRRSHVPVQRQLL